jgi:hypothetical protein
MSAGFSWGCGNTSFHATIGRTIYNDASALAKSLLSFQLLNTLLVTPVSLF